MYRTAPTPLYMFQWVRSKVYRNFLPKMPFEPNSWRSESRTAARFGVNNTRLTQDIDLRQGKRFLFIRFPSPTQDGCVQPGSRNLCTLRYKTQIPAGSPLQHGWFGSTLTVCLQRRLAQLSLRCHSCVSQYSHGVNDGNADTNVST